MVAGTDPLTPERPHWRRGGAPSRTSTQCARLLSAGSDGPQWTRWATDPNARSGCPAVHLCRPGRGLGFLLNALRGATVAERLRSDWRTSIGSRSNLACGPAGHLLHRRIAAGTARFRNGQHSRLRPYGGRVWCGADDRREHPEKTRVLSVQIYDHVEALEYAQAHWLAGGMLLFSFLVLLTLYASPLRQGWRG
jgi:hypothetical protein